MTVSHITSLTRETCQQAVDYGKSGGRFYVVKKTCLDDKDGIEIIDVRPLKDKVYDPIKGKRNIIRCFSDTHFIITENYYKKISNGAPI